LWYTGCDLCCTCALRHAGVSCQQGVHVHLCAAGGAAEEGLMSRALDECGFTPVLAGDCSMLACVRGTPACALMVPAAGDSPVALRGCTMALYPRWGSVRVTGCSRVAAGGSLSSRLHVRVPATRLVQCFCLCLPFVDTGNVHPTIQQASGKGFSSLQQCHLRFVPVVATACFI
jgi:hypothetical protein